MGGSSNTGNVSVGEQSVANERLSSAVQQNADDGRALAAVGTPISSLRLNRPALRTDESMLDSLLVVATTITPDGAGLLETNGNLKKKTNKQAGKIMQN